MMLTGRFPKSPLDKLGVSGWHPQLPRESGLSYYDVVYAKEASK